MPGFRSVLKDDQLRQVSLLLAKVDELPESVKNTLTHTDSTAGRELQSQH